MQGFKGDIATIPLLLCDSWVFTLLARQSRSEGHDGVTGTLLKMRRKAWVERGRRIVQRVVDSCLVCRKAKATKCQHVMGDLPPERTEPAAPFECTSVDLTRWMTSGKDWLWRSRVWSTAAWPTEPFTPNWQALCPLKRSLWPTKVHSNPPSFCVFPFVFSEEKGGEVYQHNRRPNACYLFCEVLLIIINNS